MERQQPCWPTGWQPAFRFHSWWSAQPVKSPTFYRIIVFTTVTLLKKLRITRIFTNFSRVKICKICEICGFFSRLNHSIPDICPVNGVRIPWLPVMCDFPGGASHNCRGGMGGKTTMPRRTAVSLTHLAPCVPPTGRGGARWRGMTLLAFAQDRTAPSRPYNDCKKLRTLLVRG